MFPLVARRWLASICALTPFGAGALAASPAPPSPTAGLAAFWPLGAPAHHWALVDYAHRGDPSAKTMMSVRNESLGADGFILWFRNKPGQAPGAEDGERYHVCAGPAQTWLYLDAYIDQRPGKPQRPHPVQSDRILYTPDGGATVDLIKSGAYAACGAAGQPYLLWVGAPAQYRIQVWGHLAENPKLVWYWDATVAAPHSIQDECLKPPRAIQAVEVREAWWSNFKVASGKWGLGDGELASNGNGPTGSGVSYGRTVWHGQGQTPYVMTGNPAGHPTWCNVQ
jgi:hypothetical protein